MKNNQKLTILFWLFKAKATRDGRAPLYARITTGGSSEEISLNRKVNPDFWDVDLKQDTEPGHEAKKTNDKISETEKELELHFKILQIKYDQITPLMLKNAYQGKSILPEEGQDEEQNAKTIIEAFDDFNRNFC